MFCDISRCSLVTIKGRLFETIEDKRLVKKLFKAFPPRLSGLKIVVLLFN